MQTDRGWVDVTICNVSSGGLMAQCRTPLERGRYVEVRYRSKSLVGRVAWSAPDRFGLLTRDRIDIEELLAEPGVGAGRTRPRTEPEPPVVRTLTLTPVEQHELSRNLSKLGQWACLVCLSLGAAFFIAHEVFSWLGRPLDDAVIAMNAINQGSGAVARPD